MALSCVCSLPCLEKSTLGGLFLCAAGDLHLSPSGALSNETKKTKKKKLHRNAAAYIMAASLIPCSWRNTSFIQLYFCVTNKLWLTGFLLDFCSMSRAKARKDWRKQNEKENLKSSSVAFVYLPSQNQFICYRLMECQDSVFVNQCLFSDSPPQR